MVTLSTELFSNYFLLRDSASQEFVDFWQQYYKTLKKIIPVTLLSLASLKRINALEAMQLLFEGQSVNMY